MNLQRSATSVAIGASVRAPALPSVRPISEAEPAPIDSCKPRRRRKRAGEDLSLRSAAVLALVIWVTLVSAATAMLEPW
jgi:hypothetical protein